MAGIIQNAKQTVVKKEKEKKKRTNSLCPQGRVSLMKC